MMCCATAWHSARICLCSGFLLLVASLDSEWAAERTRAPIESPPPLADCSGGPGDGPPSDRTDALIAGEDEMRGGGGRGGRECDCEEHSEDDECSDAHRAERMGEWQREQRAVCLCLSARCLFSSLRCLPRVVSWSHGAHWSTSVSSLHSHHLIHSSPRLSSSPPTISHCTALSANEPPGLSVWPLLHQPDHTHKQGTNRMKRQTE